MNSFNLRLVKNDVPVEKFDTQGYRFYPFRLNGIWRYISATLSLKNIEFLFIQHKVQASYRKLFTMNRKEY